MDEATKESVDPSTALHDAIFDTLLDGLIVTDLQGRIIKQNRAAERYLPPGIQGLIPEKWPETLGFYLDDGKTHFPGERMPLVRILQGESIPVEEMIWRQGAEGNDRWISMSARPLDHSELKPGDVLVLIQDISERKRIEVSREKHARRNEALYKFSRAILEAGNDLELITSVVAWHAGEWIGDSCIVSLNDPGSQQLHISAYHHPSPERRATLRKCLLHARHTPETSVLSGVLNTGEPLLIPSIPPDQLETIVIRELGPYIREYGVHSLLVAPITRNNGALGAISLARDQGSRPYTIEDQDFLLDLCSRTALAVENCRLFASLRAEIDKWLNAKQALDTSEERFQSIFESTSMGIKVLDIDGNILQTNPAFQVMLGYASNELTGLPFHRLMHPRDAPRALRLVRDLIASGAPDFRYEHRIMHREGHPVWVKTTFTAVKKGGGSDDLAFLVGIVENISEQKQIEADVAELKSRLHSNVERERLRLAQELHDGPMQELYSAIYQIEGLRDQATGDLNGSLEIIKGSLQSVLSELRSVASDLRPPAIANFGLEKAIRSYVAEHREKHPELEIRLSLAQDRQILPEEVRLALFRIFQQSLMNVVRHAEASQVSVHFSFDVEEAQLGINDNGKGFQIPSNWVQLTRAGHYGLAGAVERVEALGGRLTIDSQPGNGTRVLVTIPYQEPNQGEMQR